MQYEIEILRIYTSPGHNYFGNKTTVPKKNPTLSLDQVEAVAHKGLVGDRFFDIRPNHHAQVTFFAFEVFEVLRKDYEIADDLTLFRRNLVVKGIDLKALIGYEFQIGEVIFKGSRHCAPCKWMNRMVHPEALKLLRGRGGLQAKIVSGGVISVGQQTLSTEVHFQPGEAAAPIARLRLP